MRANVPLDRDGLRWFEMNHAATHPAVVPRCAHVASSYARRVQHRKGLPRLVAFLAPTLLASAARAAPCERAYPWSRLPESAAHFATPLPLALTAGAIAAPAIMVPTNLDYDLRLVARKDLGGSYDPEPVSIWTPYVLPGALVVVDVLALPLESCEIARPTSAMLQAMVATAITFGTMKWITSRPFPVEGNSAGPADDPQRLHDPAHARRFEWFDWSAGNAWPSGHTATMFAAASALGAATRYRHWSAYVAYAAAAGVATGMYLGDHHWASDIVSGALLGTAMGNSVGLSFRDDGDGSRAGNERRLLVAPWSDVTTSGIRVVGTW